MKYVRCTDRASTGILITWRRWQVSLGLFCVILYVATTDWDLKTGAGARDRPFAQIAWDDYEAPVRSLVFSGSTRLAVATTSAMWLNDLATGEVVRLRDCPWSFGLSPAFSPDGRILAVGGNEPAVRLWDAGEGVELEPLNVGTEAVRCVAFSPDGTTLAVTTWNSPIITLWQWPCGRRLAILDGHRGNISVLAFSPDGSRLLAANSAADVRLWDVASREERACRRVHDAGIAAVAFSSNGSLFATASFVDVAVRLWDTVTGESRGSLPLVSTGVTGVAFSPDGNTLATSRRDGVAVLWDLASGRQLGAVRAPTGSLQSIAFSGDGRVLATGGFDGSVRRWDVRKVIEEKSQEP
jgi:WD40 repeat protein